MSTLPREYRSDDTQPATGQKMFTRSTWSAVGQSLQLSPRELEIAQCIFDDDNEQSIADDLGISAHTVHTHVWRLYQKLSVHSRVALVVRVFEEYLSLHAGCDDCD